jgi:two-component system chemotaxis sensor kinase CheA
MGDTFPAEEFEEILREFGNEAAEIVASLEEDMVRLEDEPEDLELLHRIFRGMHTLKGNSAFLGFSRMKALAHEAENVLNRLRSGTLPLVPSLMDALLVALDGVKALLRDIAADRTERTEIEGTVLLLQRAAESAEREAPGENAECRMRSADREAGNAEAGEKPDGGAEAGARHPERATGGDAATIRVEVRRLDHLMNLVGELVIGRNRLHQVRGDFERKYEGESLVGDLGQVSADLSLVSSELQEAVMKVRMVPIRNIFSRFPRLVRDLAREREKAVDLVTSGHETELDRSVIEEIWDPLVHLVRNALDHGLESPRERRASGKPEKGRISMSARQEGSHIVIRVEDDGRGIDAARVLDKARRLGLVDDGDDISGAEILNLIFAPGFSTKDEISDISGRGVGLDVVKTNLKRLNGLIDVSTVPGKGTRFTLQIPLTLAIVQALLVRVDSETAAIPLASVVETVRLLPQELRTIRGRHVLRLRDNVLPLIWLHDLFHRPRPGDRRFYVIVVGLAEERVGIAVDGLLGQQEVVVKSVGNYLGEIQGLAGATILGDGRVVVILDMATLMGDARSRRQVAR